MSSGKTSGARQHRTNPPRIHGTTKSTQHSTPTSLFSLSVSPLLPLQPTRKTGAPPTSALTQRAGCRRPTGPWWRRWTGPPRARSRTTPGRCFWRGASPQLSGSGSSPRPRPSPPGGHSRGEDKENISCSRETTSSVWSAEELQVVFRGVLVSVTFTWGCKPAHSPQLSSSLHSVR